LIPPLPFAKDALSPHISAETLECHYGKHHQAYVDNLNRIISGTTYENLPLEDIVRDAAQVWNHTFYWNCLSPSAAGKPAGALLQRIEQLQKQFTETAAGLFSSGWAWLVLMPNGTLELRAASAPLTTRNKPLLYYIDRRSARPKHFEAFWKLANWDFVARNMKD
jgi:Fe-Mn family superoxide dismutase